SRKEGALSTCGFPISRSYGLRVMKGAEMIHTVLAVMLLGAATTGGQVEAAPQVAGVWRGTSGCMVKNSPCHDETNVYRITAIAGKSYRYRVAGRKIGAGQE